MAEETRIQISGVDAPVLQAAVEGTGVRAEEKIDDFGPIAAIVLIGGLVALAKVVLGVIDEARGGTVIDLTKNPIDVRRDHDLNYLFFIIKTPDGKVTVEGKDAPKDALERMISDILKLAADASVGAVKAALDAAKIEQDKVKTETSS